MIGDEFHPAAVAISAEIRALFGEIGEQAHAGRNRLTVAAGIDHEVADLRLRTGSTERTIERRMTGVLERRLELKLVCKAQCGEFDHRTGRLAGFGNGLRDIAYSRRRR